MKDEQVGTYLYLPGSVETLLNWHPKKWLYRLFSAKTGERYCYTKPHDGGRVSTRPEVMNPPEEYRATKKLKKRGWEELGHPPEWVWEKANPLRTTAGVGTITEFKGDTYVYAVYVGSFNHGRDYRYFRKLKSDYYTTGRNQGTCPNCQAYIRRFDTDLFLTCH